MALEPWLDLRREGRTHRVALREGEDLFERASQMFGVPAERLKLVRAGKRLRRGDAVEAGGPPVLVVGSAAALGEADRRAGSGACARATRALREAWQAADARAAGAALWLFVRTLAGPFDPSLEQERADEERRRAEAAERDERAQEADEADREVWARRRTPRA